MGHGNHARLRLRSCTHATDLVQAGPCASQRGRTVRVAARARCTSHHAICSALASAPSRARRAQSRSRRRPLLLAFQQRQLWPAMANSPTAARYATAQPRAGRCTAVAATGVVLTLACREDQGASTQSGRGGVCGASAARAGELPTGRLRARGARDSVFELVWAATLCVSGVRDGLT